MTTDTRTAQREIEDGNRFGFGANWSAFLSVVDEPRVLASIKSLTALLPARRIEGHTFLDVGCGSGLSSLAAQRIGAAKVCSFDFDAQSVASTRELKRRLAPDAQDWAVMQGSILDAECVRRLGTWDVVYSWGVLHHTGQMWDALANAAMLVRPGGTLFIAIYNDQGTGSRRWSRVKRIYNHSGIGRLGVIGAFVPAFVLSGLAQDIVRGESPIKRYRSYFEQRGMSRYHDWVDWLGGLPFEVATPEQIFDFYRDRGFTLERLQTCGGGMGCNQFVFRAPTEPCSAV